MGITDMSTRMYGGLGTPMKGLPYIERAPIKGCTYMGSRMYGYLYMARSVYGYPYMEAPFIGVPRCRGPLYTYT